MPTKLIATFYDAEQVIDVDTYAELNALSQDEREAVMAIVYAEIHS
jgi:hypothetical protein